MQLQILAISFTAYSITVSLNKNYEKRTEKEIRWRSEWLNSFCIYTI